MKHLYLHGTLISLCFFVLPCKMMAKGHSANVVMESSAVKGESLVSKFFLHLPDSFNRGSYREREIMLQQGKSYNADNKDFSEDMTVVVRDDQYLIFVDACQEQGIIRVMPYWDTDDESLKMLGTHQGDGTIPKLMNSSSGGFGCSGGFSGGSSVGSFGGGGYLGSW